MPKRTRPSPLRRAVVALLLAGSACGPDAADPADDAAPTDPADLLVLVVVDQLRADLLARNADLMRGGLARLLDRGASFEPTRVDHAVTNSGPGHATLATGVHPSAHGIVDNSFFLRDGVTWRYGPAPLDRSATLLGDPDAPAFSSTNRLVPALGDWARSHDPAARSVAIGQGAHSTNAMAAHRGGQAWWFSAERGGYVTSDHYLDAVPDWVARFNADSVGALMADGTWDVEVPVSVRDRAVPDDAPWEAREGRAVFPHGVAEQVAGAERDDPVARARWLEGSPGIDRATLGLARAAVRALDLGGRGSVDVLTLNLSSTDEAGHRYGPWSLEQLDVLLRLDRELGVFMDFLDAHLGQGRWALALSADHGSATPPEQVVADGGAAVRVDPDAVAAAYEALAARLSDAGTAPEVRFPQAREVLEALPFVARVYSAAELATPEGGDDPYLPLYRNSFHPDRRLDFPLWDASGRTTPVTLGVGAVRMTEDAMMDYATSIHGSPYDHDRSVPFLLLGPGVEPGVRPAARTVDVAPTLAALGGLAVPPGMPGMDRSKDPAGPG